MKRRWIKFVHDRNTYVIDLSCINTFTFTENGRLIFGLPDTRGKVQIILHPKSNSEAYGQILDYLEKTRN